MPPSASSPRRRLSGHPFRAHTGLVGTTQGFPAHRPCCGFYLGPSLGQQGPRAGLSPGPGCGPQGTLWTEWRVLWRCSAHGPCGGEHGVGEDCGCPNSHLWTVCLPRALGGSPWALRAALWPWPPPLAQPCPGPVHCSPPEAGASLRPPWPALRPPWPALHLRRQVARRLPGDSEEPRPCWAHEWTGTTG